MKKKSNNGSAVNDPDLEISSFTRAEIKKGIMGKYAPQDSLRLVNLDPPDVAKIFRNSREVNEALRIVQKLRQIGKTARRRKSA